jgi:hypothetical protein
MQRPNNEYYKPLFYNYLKANLKNDTTIESIESVEKSTIYKTNYERFIYEIVSGAVKLGVILNMERSLFMIFCTKVIFLEI